MSTERNAALLQFIHDRMVNVHGENPHYDYMLGLRNIIQDVKLVDIVARIPTTTTCSACAKLVDIVRAVDHHNRRMSSFGEPRH